MSALFLHGRCGGPGAAVGPPRCVLGCGGGSTRGSGLNRGRQPREWRVRGGWRPPRGVRGGGQARPGLCGDGVCVWEARRGRSGARAGPEARGTPARGVRAGGEGPTRWPVPLRVAGKRPGRPAARGSLSARESPPLHKMAPAGSVSLPFPPSPPFPAGSATTTANGWFRPPVPPSPHVTRRPITSQRMAAPANGRRHSRLRRMRRRAEGREGRGGGVGWRGVVVVGKLWG